MADASRRSLTPSFADHHGMPLQDIHYPKASAKRSARGRSGSRRRRNKGSGGKGRDAINGFPERTHSRSPSRGSSADRPLCIPSTDSQGRPFDLRCVIVNFNNVGTTYGKRMLPASHAESSCPWFHWEGVRLCVKYLTQAQYRVIGVIFTNWLGLDGTMENLTLVTGVPSDIAQMCDTIEETPRICGSHQQSADDEMTIKMAYRRNCRMLDNDNYRDWTKHHPDAEIRRWLKQSRRCVQMNYFFDFSLGCFETLDGLRIQNGAQSSDTSAEPCSSRRAQTPQESGESTRPGKGSSKSGKRQPSRRGKGRSASRKPGRSLIPEGEACRKVHVGNLPFDVKWHLLKEHMSQAGDVEFVKVATEDGKASSRSLGWACVLFAEAQGAEHAVATLDAAQLRGRALTVRRWIGRSRSISLGLGQYS